MCFKTSKKSKLEVWEGITVKELSSAAKISPHVILRTLNSALVTKHKADNNSSMIAFAQLVKL